MDFDATRDAELEIVSFGQCRRCGRRLGDGVAPRGTDEEIRIATGVSQSCRLLDYKIAAALYFGDVFDTMPAPRGLYREIANLTLCARELQALRAPSGIERLRVSALESCMSKYGRDANVDGASKAQQWGGASGPWLRVGPDMARIGWTFSET